MKISIIGGGNMGGSIVRGLAKCTSIKTEDITVIDIVKQPLDLLKKDFPEINIAINNHDSLSQADIVILAVKPWMVQDAILDIKFKLDYNKQILISIAAGVSIDEMSRHLDKPSESQSLPALFKVIPNTAISVCQSMTLVSTNNASNDQIDFVLKIFNELGKAILIDEDKLNAGTALTSCGIAYLFRYVRAAMLAGTELGFYPKDARNLIINTMKGAAELLIQTGSNPEDEIDKVVTPGGITIKGLNELEAYGYSNAIIKAMKASK